MSLKSLLEQIGEVQDLFDDSDDPEKLREALENKDLEEASKYTDMTVGEIKDLFGGLMEESERFVNKDGGGLYDGGRKGGVVDFFHERKGYGFIVADDGEEDVFFWFDGSEDIDVEEGDRVTFMVVEGEKGPRAVNLEKE